MSDGTVTLLWSFIVSIYAIGGMLGGVCAGALINKFGRKGAMFLNNIPVIVGCVLMFSSKYAWSYEMLLVGRLIIGFAAGVSTGVAPVYLSEIAPLHLRGAAGTLNQFTIVLGILIANIIGFDSILGNSKLWPSLFGVALLPAVIQLILLPLCPESPRYLLLNQNKREEAEKALSWLRGLPAILLEPELEEMENERLSQAQVSTVGLSDFFTRQWLLQPLIISVVMQLSQQLSGINAVIYYSTSIFEGAGLSHSVAQDCTILLGLVNLIMTFISALIMDRAGRRTLHLIGLGGMFFSAILLTVAFLGEDKWSFLSYISIIAAVGFIIFFATGPGSIPWFIVAELFSQGPRGVAMSIAVVVNWLANFTVGVCYPLLQKSLKEYSFVPFVVLIAIFWIFTFLKVPETKGRTIEEITSQFRTNDAADRMVEPGSVAQYGSLENESSGAE